MKPALALICILPAASPVHAGDCTTDELKAEAISDFIEEHYGSTFKMIYSTEAGLMEVYFHPYEPQERDCEGKVRVADDCRITDAEGGPLGTAGARERAFECRLSSD